MKINLLGHCLICLDKTEDDKLISSSVSRVIFANQVLPQLLLEKSTEKENSIRELFNKLHFCSSGGDEGKGEEKEEDDKAPSSPPPFCVSCVEEQSALLKILKELQLKTEELRSRIAGGGGGGAFQSLLRKSEVVEDETKETTLGFLECLREECCDNTATQPEINSEKYDDDDQDCNDPEKRREETECQELIHKKNKEGLDEEDEVVEVPGPPPKDVPVVDISDEDEEGGAEAEEVMLEEEDYYNKVIDVEEIMVLPDDLIIDKVEGCSKVIPEQDQKPSNDGLVHPQMLNVRGVGGVPQSGPSKMFPCPKANCNKTYTNHRHLLQHLGVAHGPANPSSNCEYCGKGYSTIYKLKCHIKSEHLMTNYICGICGKKFGGNSNLKKHYLTHAKSYAKSCADDGSNFSSHLKRHQSIMKKK